MRLGVVTARLRTDALAVWLGNFGSVSLRFALNVLIARLGGADQMGVYVALLALTFIIARFTDLGLPNAVVYFVRSQRQSTRKCLSVCLMHSLFMMPAAVVLLFCATSLGLANSDSSQVIAASWLLLGALSTTQLLGGLISQLLIPLNGFRSYGCVMVVSPLVSMAMCVAFGQGIQARELIIAILTGETCAAACGLALLCYALPPRQDSPPSPGFVAIYRYALKGYVGISLKALSQRADRLVLSWFLPNSLLAAYAVAVGLRDNAVLPITTHAMLLRNQLIDREQRADGHRGARAFLRGELIRWTLISSAMAIGLAIAATLALPTLYGPQFRSAVSITVILCATLPMIAIATLCWTGLLSAARPDAVSFGLIFGSITNLCALYVGARIAGATGASWGAVIAAVIASCWWLVAGFRPRAV